PSHRPTDRTPPSFPTRRSSDLACGPLTRPELDLDGEIAPLGAEEQIVLHLQAQAPLRVRRDLERHHVGTPHREDGRRAAFDGDQDRKSTRLNSCHVAISYAVFC